MNRKDKIIFTTFFVVVGLCVLFNPFTYAKIIILPGFCYTLWGMHIVPYDWEKTHKDDKKKDEG